MKKSFIYASLLLAAASCTQNEIIDDAAIPSSPKHEITVNVAAPGSRVEIEAADDKWSLTWSQNENIGGWQASELCQYMMTEYDDEAAKFMGMAGVGDIRFVYPYDADLEVSNSYAINLASQTVDMDDAFGYYAENNLYMLSEKVAIAADTEEVSAFAMNNLLSGMTLKITGVEGYSVLGATISNVPASATVDFESGVATAGAVDAVELVVENPAALVSGEAMVLPFSLPACTLSGDIIVDLQLTDADGYKYTTSITKEGVNADLEAATFSNINVAFSADDVVAEVAQLSLATISADNYPQNVSLWIFDESEATTDELAGLKAALTAAKSKGDDKVTVRFENLEVVPAAAFKGYTDLYAIELPVATLIRANAFEIGEGKDGFYYISAPNVEEIEGYAFKNTDNLKEFYFPKLKKLGIGAINWSNCLDVLTLGTEGSGIEALGGMDFVSPVPLLYIKFADSYTDWSIENNYLHYGTKTQEFATINDGASILKSLNPRVAIGTDTWTLMDEIDCETGNDHWSGAGAYGDLLANLRDAKAAGRQITLKFPNLTRLNHNPFQASKSGDVLYAIELPVLTKLLGWTFQDSKYLKSVKAEKVSKFDNSAPFKNCENLTEVVLDWENLTILTASAFENCRSLMITDFPYVTSVGGYAFKNYDAVEEINLPVVETIGVGAFTWCNNLTSLKLGVDGNGVKSFYNDSKYDENESGEDKCDLTIKLAADSDFSVEGNVLTIKNGLEIPFKSITVVE